MPGRSAGPEEQDINTTVLSGNSQPSPDALGGNRVTWQEGSSFVQAEWASGIGEANEKGKAVKILGVDSKNEGPG